MRALTIPDQTQNALLAELAFTERLLSRALSLEHSKTVDAEIIALPDLGFSNNIIRMKGGFFTGCLIHWNTEIPFVPVDTTVNVCNISVFTISYLQQVFSHD